MINLKKQDPVADAVKDILQQEALKGNQHKIDKNKNNKIDSHDFKILRGEKPEVKEGWNDMLKAGKERAEKEKEEMGTGKFNKQEMKPGVVRYIKKPEKYEPAEKTQKEEVEVVYEANIEPTSAKSRSHISNLSNPITNTVTHPSSGKEIGIITKQPSGEYYAHHSAAKLSHAESGTFDSKDKAHQFIRNAHAKAIKNNTLSDRWIKQKKLPQFAKEEVEQIDELSKSTLGSYTKKASRDATITRKIGADFENNAKRSRSPGMKAAANSLSDKYKSKSWKRKAGIDKAVDRLTKEEVEQVQEREMTSGETTERERIVKGMKKSLKGFKARYGERAKSVMYATATKSAMKEETIEEGKRPEGDTVPFVTGANTTSSPMNKIKEVASAAMKKISKDLKTK